MWLGGIAVGCTTCDQWVAGSNPRRPTVDCNPGKVVNTHVPLSQSRIILYQPVGWEGNRRSGVALSTRQTSVVPHLQAQGLEEGDEHPPTLSWGAWLTLPFTFTFGGMEG